MRSHSPQYQTGFNYRSTALWPDSVAYREAIQNPRAVLTDPDLQNAEVVLDRRGFPVAYSGRFAIVFRLRTPSGDWAVRCFTQSADMRDRHLRYAAIARRLQGMKEHFVPFRYIERGIRIGTDWYPVVAMRWAGGETMGKFVDRCHRDPQALKTLLLSLTELLEKLEAVGIAHGDWQHDNILVADGGKTLTLVDYDGMFVPEMTGAPALETGHANYQHPGRTANHFGVGLDRFSHTALKAALLALCREPDLWASNNDGESILFKAKDYEAPHQSALLTTLRALATGDAALAAALEELEQSLRQPFHVWKPSAEAMAMVLEEPEPAAAVPLEDKWWLAPDVAHYYHQPAARTATVASPFLARLQDPEAEQAEQANFWTVRAAVLARAALFAVLWAVTGRAELLWLWAAVSATVVGMSYHSWPRRSVSGELQAAINAEEMRIREIDEELAKKRSALSDVHKALFTTNAQSFVDAELQKTDIGRVYYDTFLPTTVIDQLRTEGVLHAVGLRGRQSVRGVRDEDMVVLQRWFEDQEKAALRYFDQLTGEVNRLQAEVTDLEREMMQRQQERDRLDAEARQLPEASLGLYLRRLNGVS